MRSRSSRLLGVTVLGAALALFTIPVFGSIRTANRVIVTENDVVTEDLYAVGARTIVEGVIEGDLLVLGGELTITGRIEGDVVGLVGGPARISGVVGGSVRLAAVSLSVSGTVGDDVSSLVAEADVTGTVGRDVLIIGGNGEVGAAVGRDVRAQAWRLTVSGEVGRDVIARVDDMRVAASARVDGDVSFRASDESRISAEAEINGLVTRRRVLAPVWAKALTRAFSILSVFAFAVAGIAVFWLFRSTAPRAVQLVGERPWRAALVGLGVVLLFPVLMLPLFLALVGIPVAVALLLAWAAALFLGAIPAVAWGGERLLRDRGGLMAGFLLGALLWRGAMWALSLVAILVYLIPTLVGVGAFTLAAWEQRRRALIPAEAEVPEPVGTE